MIKNYSKQSPLTQLKIMLVLVKATPSKRDLGTPWGLFLKFSSSTPVLLIWESLRASSSSPLFNKILSDYDLVINKCCDMFPGS